MTEREIDNLYYFCSLIEFITRKTKNHHKYVISYFTPEIIERQLDVAEVNHCLSFEQVSDELISNFSIPLGDFDYTSNCLYEVPTNTQIGSVYSKLIRDVMKDNLVSTIIEVFSSFICDYISNFNSDVYYQSPNYMKYCYEIGEIIYD